MVYVGLNNKDEAFASLKKAYQERFNPSVIRRPCFDPLRADPGSKIYCVHWSSVKIMIGRCQSDRKKVSSPASLWAQPIEARSHSSSFTSVWLNRFLKRKDAGHA